MPTAASSRKYSFLEHLNTSIPVLPVDGLARKRERLHQMLERPLGSSTRPRGCLMLPSDSSKCPRSFGNLQQLFLSALLSSSVLQTRLKSTSSVDCNSMLQFKQHDRLLATTRKPHRVVQLDKASCSRWMSSAMSLSDDECLSLPATDHGQTTAWCFQDEHLRSRRGARALQSSRVKRMEALFALGPHAAYGAAFDAAFALPNETVPTWREDELRISVHVRHFDPKDDGSASTRTFERAIREAAKGATVRGGNGEHRKRCALLVASDRRQTLHYMKNVARRVGCRMIQSARERVERDYSLEHGDDVGAVLLRDVFLLAHGDVLIGTWGSTLTLLLQQLVAARSTGHIPTVVYCDLSYKRCLTPLPLLTNERNAWYLNVEGTGATRIFSPDAMEAATEWKEWQRRQESAALEDSSGYQGAPVQPHACSVTLLKQLSNKAKCVLGSTFGCFAGGRVMWISGGCRGRFKCSDSVVSCGFPRQNGDPRNCTCLTEQWPTTRETVTALKRIRWPAVAATQNAWLGAIISGNKDGVRYHATASAVASCGFHPQHVVAAQPSDYASSSAMLVEAFGVPTRHLIRMSPHEIGLVISHRRALAMIADSQFSWGAVFEDDAYLHNAITAVQAGHLLRGAFTAVDREYATRPAFQDRPVLYLGGCDPRCAMLEDQNERNRNWTMKSGFSMELFRTGQCRAFCTHAYALRKEQAATFFADIFNCHPEQAKEACGGECEFRPCFMDWAMTRYFMRQGHEAWILGGGLRSPWRQDHRGLFIQNRSRELGNDVKGTSLGGSYHWAAERACPSRKDAITNPRPLSKVLVNIRWTGRLGNLLFEFGSLMGIVASLQDVAPAEAMTFRLPAKESTPAMQFFEEFGLAKVVHVDTDHSAFADAFDHELHACTACTYVLKERRANSFEQRELASLKQWVTSPPPNCTVGLVSLNGYFQSFKYFDTIQSKVDAALATLTSATQQEARSILTAVRANLPSSALGWKLVGVQVRLGDMRSDRRFAALYAHATWKYYRVAMRALSRTLEQREPGVKVAFVVTAGGTRGSNEADIREAYTHLSGAAEQVSFSNASNPYVDLDVLRNCDALVIGPSTFGWWAAHLSKLPSQRLVIAPSHVFNPELPRHTSQLKGFRALDYFPSGWILLANNGTGRPHPMSEHALPAQPQTRSARQSLVVDSRHAHDRQPSSIGETVSNAPDSPPHHRHPQRREAPQQSGRIALRGELPPFWRQVFDGFTYTISWIFMLVLPISFVAVVRLLW